MLPLSQSFDTNKFEQLCINYANERLQQKYVFDNFNTAQEEYTAEGIEVFDFSIVDNSDVVDLFEGKGRKKLGLISVLGEECTRPTGTDVAFVQKLKKLVGDSSRLFDDKLHDRHEFGIKHFAGLVTYNAKKFLQVRNVYISLLFLSYVLFGFLTLSPSVILICMPHLHSAMNIEQHRSHS